MLHKRNAQAPFRPLELQCHFYTFRTISPPEPTFVSKLTKVASGGERVNFCAATKYVLAPFNSKVTNCIV